MKLLTFASIVLLIFVAACQSNQPTPTPTSTEVVQTALTRYPTFTPTVLPTVTPQLVPTLAPPTATPTPMPNDVWVNAASGLNLRTDAKTTAKLVVILKQGQHLIAIGPKVGPDASSITWQNVRTDDGQTGWVSAEFLTTTKPGGAATPAPAAATPAATTGEAWVNAADGLNLRTQSNATSTLIATLPFAQHLTTIGAKVGPDSNGITWQNVRTDDGKTGWVAAQYLASTKPTTPATPVATPPPKSTTVVTTPVASTTDLWVNATGGVNLRSQANVTAPVIATLSLGQHLTALGAKTTPSAGGIAWQNVRTDSGQTGWAAADFLTTTSPTTPTASTAAITATAALNSTSNAMIADLLNRINILRDQNGLPSLTWNNLLAAAALRHSQDMANTGNVSHTGLDGSEPQTRVKAAGYPGTAADEVIYGGQVSVDDVWHFWTTDKIHSRVLLNPKYKEIGIAIVGKGPSSYYTGDLGGP